MSQDYKKKRHLGQGISTVQQQGSPSPLPIWEIKTASRKDKAHTYENQPWYFGFGLENEPGQSRVLLLGTSLCNTQMLPPTQTP